LSNEGGKPGELIADGVCPALGSSKEQDAVAGAEIHHHAAVSDACGQQRTRAMNGCDA